MLAIITGCLQAASKSAGDITGRSVAVVVVETVVAAKIIDLYIKIRAYSFRKQNKDYDHLRTTTSKRTDSEFEIVRKMLLIYNIGDRNRNIEKHTCCSSSQGSCCCSVCSSCCSNWCGYNYTRCG